MPRTRPPYPPEFRAEAVRLVKSSGETIAQVAKDLGISDQTLRNWRPGLHGNRRRAELRRERFVSVMK